MDHEGGFELTSSLGRETAGEAQIMMFQATNEGFIQMLEIRSETHSKNRSF